MPRTTHPLDNWFYSKPRIKQAGIEAILIDEPWEQFLARHHYWTTEDVTRVRCLLRPTEPEIEQFLAKAVFDDESLSPSLLEAWQRPREDCFAGCGLQVSSFPTPIFNLSMDGILWLAGIVASWLAWGRQCLKNKSHHLYGHGLVERSSQRQYWRRGLQHISTFFTPRNSYFLRDSVRNRHGAGNRATSKQLKAA
jgi:hypothetical protein